MTGTHTRSQQETFTRRTDPKNSSKTIKITYRKTETQTSQDPHLEYFILARKEDYEKWKKDKSYAIVNVVETFDVYKSGNKTSDHGVFERPGKKELEEVFGCGKVDDVVERILNEGSVH